MPLSRVLTYGFLALFMVLHIVAVGKLTEQHIAFQKSGNQDQLFVLPSQILKIAALDYKGIISDFLFIKGIAYLGGFASQKGSGAGQLQLSDVQWRAFYNVMDVSTDLDPYFQDPYYLANAFLTWDAGMVRETNALLEKGSRYRDWDWTLPFFSGFNYFYFLQENDKASERLMEASRRPGASPVLASLASKLAFKANKTENSVLFLEEMIRKTDDESMKKLFETRVEALRAIRILEDAVNAYQHKFKRAPKDVEELVAKNIISQLPQDPYGGTYSIAKDGRVKSTTSSQLEPYLSPAQKSRR